MNEGKRGKEAVHKISVIVYELRASGAESGSHAHTSATVKYVVECYVVVLFRFH